MAGQDGLGAALAAAFSRHGAEIALEIGRETYSYADLWGRARRFAERHRAQVGADGAVGFLSQRKLEAYVAILGAVILGRPYVSLNMKFPLERQLHIARESRCRVIIADAETEPRRRELMTALSLTDRVGCGGEASERPIGDDDPVYYMFTSGTTGAPKGVVVARRNVAAFLKGVDEVLKLPPGVRCTQLYDLSFDASVHDVFYTWYAGGTLCPMTPADGSDYVAFARAKRIGCWYSVPSAIAVAQRNGWLAPGALPDLRYCLFVGEALPTSLARQWLEACPQATGFNLYGPTEATVTITGRAFTQAFLEGSELPTVPIGFEFVDTEIALVNPQGELAGPGESGELWLGGPQVVVGYLNNPAETDRRFVSETFAGYGSHRWYRTGDLGERSSDGELVYLGRLDDQVKIRGYRVELFEVEEAVRAAAGSQEAAAVPWPVTETGGADGLVAFVAGASQTDEQILASCAARLPTYMVPSRILRVEKLPLNQNGKVDRKALRQQYLEGSPERQFRPIGDAGEVERRLIQGWSRLFPDREVDANSTFASMNGDSLSYINTLLETETLVGSLPPDWVGLSIGELARAAAPEAGLAMTRVDIPALIRMAAISLVLVGHFGITTINTGAVGAMMLLSGYFFGAVQLSGMGEPIDVRRLLHPLLPLAAIYYGLYIPVTWLLGGKVGAADLLVLQDLTSGGTSFLWYVHAMVHLVMAAALLAWGAQAVKQAIRGRFSVPMATVAAMLVLGALVSYGVPAVLAHPVLTTTGEQADAVWRYSFVGQMFVFGCGAILALRSDRRGRLFALGLLAASGLISMVFRHTGEGVATLVSAAALVFVTDLRMPRLLARPIYAIADASLFLYLFHPVISQLMAPLGYHRPARLAAVLVVGVGLAWAHGRVMREPALRRAWQRLAKLRPFRPAIDTRS